MHRGKTARTRRLIATAAAVLAGACGSAGPTSTASLQASSGPAALDAAEALWMSKRPVSYHVREQRICECLPGATREMLVFVTRRQGAITPSPTEMFVRATYTQSGDEVPAEFTTAVSTVQQLFGLIRDAMRRSAARVEVTYDPAFGYPTHIVLDYDAVVADDEFEYHLGGLTIDD